MTNVGAGPTVLGRGTSRQTERGENNMWIYEKKLQYPVKIKNSNPKLAQLIISQLGGPDGELAASMRYLHQRYSCPYDKITGMLTDIGTEELAHLEIIAAIIHQLTRNLSEEQIESSPFATYFVDHTTGAYPVAASGVPFDMKYVGIKGDILTDLNEDLAADAAIAKAQRRRLKNVRELTIQSALLRFAIPTQILPCRNSGERIAKLNKNTGKERCLVQAKIAGKGVGKCCNCARQLQRTHF